MKNLDARVVRVWEGLRPVTRRMLVGIMQSSGNPVANPTLQKYSYDAHADWEISRLLSALDEPGKTANHKAAAEAERLAETCALILETQSASAEVFIQLAVRALRQHDYKKLDSLADVLHERYSAGEIAEIIRQTTYPHIRAIAYETLVLLSVPAIASLLDDPIYAEIAMSALEQKAVEYESAEAKELLDQIEMENDQEQE